MSNRRISQSKLKRQGFEKKYGLSSLRRCSGTREEEELKERIADEMLQALPLDPEYPSHSERQLDRQNRRRCVVRIDAIADTMISERPSQSTMDELKFLTTLTPLSSRERFFLRGWMLGWSQGEITARWWEQLGLNSRYTVSRVLKQAVEKCGKNEPISFRAMSRQTVYRRPKRRSSAWRMVVCTHCKEPFLRGFGEGIYCSRGCRFAFGREE
jgi:hypothetical protein